MNKNLKLKDITTKSRLFTTDNKDTAELIENLEPYSIAQIIGENKNAFDILCTINYILADLLDLLKYNIETEEEQKDFDKLIKIKDLILEIKNKYVI